jgi:hypothetical protein
MVAGHHSFMSASDAAPLPRLGEVFFDVRGSSRSMRLSWYADTGVAVFSIWQGGMCTGTFRLPIGDLPRMVEILQRGPQGQGHAAAQPGTGQGEPRPVLSGQQDFPTGSMVRPGSDSRYPGEPRFGGHGREGYLDPAANGYGQDEPPGSRRRGYDRDELAPAHPAGYRPAPATGPVPPGHGRDGFTDGPYPGYQSRRPAEGGHAGHGRDQSGETMAASFAQERIVPPYVPSPAGEYVTDIPGQADDRPTGPAPGAYPDEPPASRSDADEYQEPQWAPADYSDGQRYRLPAGDSAALGGHVASHSDDEPAGYRLTRERRASRGSGDEWPGRIDAATRDYPAGGTR